MPTSRDASASTQNQALPVDQQPQPCCTHLRCKSMFYRADERPGRLHDEEAMGYWCAQTNTDLGPDGKAAGHKACQPGRTCYED